MTVDYAAVVAANIREIRTAKGIRQEELAASVREHGVKASRAAVSKIETGLRRVTVNELVAFGLALGVGPVRLLGPLTVKVTVQITEGDPE